jgi:addiction module RelE/StbE family toxin
MGKYKIRIFQTAQDDLREIVEYLNTLSPQAALKYYDLIVEKIGSLAEMPERYPLARDAQLRLRGYRTLLVKSYIVFYVVKDDVVEIRRIIYARRQYEWLL